MRQAISSVFILILLLISLWGISTWWFGLNNKKSIENFLTTEQMFIKNGFEYEVIDLKHSLFGSTAKIVIDLSSIGFLNLLGIEAEQKLTLNIDMFNGPLLIDKSAAYTGNSIWHITLDKTLINKQWLSELNITEFPTAVIYVDMENQIKYKINHQDSNYQFALNGFYQPEYTSSSGVISVDNFAVESNQNTINFKQAFIEYDITHNESSFEKFNLQLSSPKTIYKHQAMSKPINLELKGTALSSLTENDINSNSEIFLESKGISNYPIEQAKFTFYIKQLSLDKLYLLAGSYENIKDLKQQSKWVLDEQTETPEGQDKFWLLNDESKRLKTNLPVLTQALLLKNKKPNIEFTLENKYQNRSSKLTGNMLPSSDENSSENTFNGIDNREKFTTFWSLFKIQAKVNLDQFLLDYIAKHLPITKSNFELRYEDNKLLMQ